MATIAIAALLAVFAGYAAKHHWLLWLAASVGGLGGLVHEVAQGGGKILFFERKLDGIYIGSLAGMVLGGVAGVLSVRAFLLDPKLISSTTEVTYEALLAGLALKGVVDAAGGQAIPPGMRSVTPAQAAVTEHMIESAKAKNQRK